MLGVFKSRADFSPRGPGEEPPLHVFIRDEEVRELRKLEKQPPATVTALLGAVNSLGQNAFHVAAEVGDPDIIKILVKAAGKNSALINARDASGATPIFTAVKSGCKHAVRELAKVGADMSIVDQKGSTVFHAPFLAPFLEKGHVSVVKELCSYKELNVNTVDAAGISPLQAACAKGAYDCAKVLIGAKADPTLVKGGDPPLFSAVIADNSALVRILLEAGADVGQPNSTGQALMEVINPKCEIYRIIKKFLIDRPGGLRKLQLMSEETFVASEITDLPADVLKLVDRSGLSHKEIQANWRIFCSIVRLVAKKRIVATAEEAAELDARKGEEVFDKDVDHSQTLAALTSQLLTPGDPKKIFKKMRVAGGGGFGMVFQGTGPDKRQWAIKRMPHNSNSEKLANLREANFLRECNHRNICSYKATYECVKQHELWLIMELLEGGTFDESIGNSEEAKFYFEERHLAFAAGEIMKALEYLHARNVVHRDLKSQNVMFTYNGEIKLIDFGAAVSIADTTVVHTEMIGSPYWMAPEMITRQPHSWPVDIWGSAVCLLELANHRPPDNSSVLRHLFHVATGNRPWLDRPDNWSEVMRDFLDQCLQFDPKNRPRAAILLRHKWIATKACSQPEMSKILQKIFAVRAYGDV